MLPQRSHLLWPALAALFMVAMEQTAMSAEVPRERTLQEIKQESIARAVSGSSTGSHAYSYEPRSTLRSVGSTFIWPRRSAGNH